MLVLTRKVGERILVGDNIVVTILKINGRTVKVGLEANRDIPIVRGELKGQPGNGKVSNACALSAK